MADNLANSMRNLLERVPRRAETEEIEGEYMAFANGRIGTRPQLALLFRRANGAVHSFVYTHLFSVESENPDVGFTLVYSAGKSVTVTGRGLSGLFESICTQRAAEIVEASQSESLKAKGNGGVVESIQVQGDRHRPRTLS